MSAWLDIIGIGEDGMEGLAKEARTRLENAEIIIGGDRHHRLTSKVTGERISWPSPFDAMIDVIKSYRGKKLVILVTGDPLWYSVGARISRAIPVEEINFYPQLSAFQWAACRLGWSLADCETLTIHGRPVEQLIPKLAPNIKLLILTKDKTSPQAVANLLCDQGYDKSPMTVLGALGGCDESRFDGIAADWDHYVPDFHLLAVECIAGENVQHYSTTGGIPDDAFVHDGQLTKRVVRAATISALRPYPDSILWDIGAGCGSVGIEWMRAARGAQAIAIEPNEKRLKMIRQNALKLGAPRILIVERSAPEGLKNLTSPDAIFIGGGLTGDRVFDSAWAALRAGGRLVANAVTLESEGFLFSLFNQYGGHLERISVSEVTAVGAFKGMKPYMSVLQWSVTKAFSADGDRSAGNE